MKIFSALILFVALSLTSAFAVSAQTAETIWIQTNTTTYKTRETVTVTINAISAAHIQGFNAQIRYDPACLQPVSSTSPIPGMNGLAVPQISGLADISFASTTPQMANGVLAEVRFTALKDCQTSLNIETAALVMRNESGFAVPIAAVNINLNAIALMIDDAVGVPQPEVSGESVLPLVPTIFPEPQPVNWRIVALLVLAGVLLTMVVGLYKLIGPSVRQPAVRRHLVRRMPGQLE